jgi:alkylhydroperoxidase family enzyme
MWIRSIAPEDATGLVKRVYDAAVRRAGKVFQIVRAMSLAPETMEASLELYKRVMLAPGGLSRRQRELLAVVVSRENACHY